MATGTDTGGAIYLITGPMAAGKSSVAGLLAKRFTRAVHLEGDLFRRSILSGREEMSPEPSSEAIAQLRLRYRLAAVAADVYHGAGFTVAVEDVVGGAFLREYIALIRSRPLHVVVLVPSFEALAAREAGREQKGYLRWQIAEHRTRFLAETPRIGLWFDSSDQSPDETVDDILRRTANPGESPRPGGPDAPPAHEPPPGRIPRSPAASAGRPPARDGRAEPRS